MKLLTKLYVLSFFFSFFLSSIYSQVNYTANSSYVPTSLENKSLVILYTNKYSISKELETNNKSTNTSEEDAMVLKALEYDAYASKEMGSYVNPYSNSLKIVMKDEKKYTKMQLNSKDTGLAVLKLDLSNGKNALDLSQIEPGRYILIMTDEQNGIFSEDIFIF